MVGCHVDRHIHTKQVHTYHIKIWCNFHVTSMCVYKSHRFRQAMVVIRNELEVCSSLIAFVHLSVVRCCAVLGVINHEWYYSLEMGSHPGDILLVSATVRVGTLHQAISRTVSRSNTACQADLRWRAVRKEAQLRINKPCCNDQTIAADSIWSPPAAFGAPILHTMAG